MVSSLRSSRLVRGRLAQTRRRSSAVSRRHCGDHPKGRRGRVGGAVVELAICLPILTLLVIGTIETCDLIFLRTAMTTAVYAGTLEAAKQEADEASVVARIRESLDASQISGATVAVSGLGGRSFDDTPPGQFVQLRVVVPVRQNTRISQFVTPRRSFVVRVRPMR